MSAAVPHLDEGEQVPPDRPSHRQVPEHPDERDGEGLGQHRGDQLDPGGEPRVSKPGNRKIVFFSEQKRMTMPMPKMEFSSSSTPELISYIPLVFKSVPTKPRMEKAKPDKIDKLSTS